MIMTIHQTSDRGIRFIKNHEGLRLKPYKDQAGLWTVGYGHLMDQKAYGSLSNTEKGKYVITPEEAESLLRSDLKRFERAVAEHVLVPLNQNQFDALVSFAFNNGISAFTQSTLLKKLNARDYVGAAEQFMRWVYYTTPKGVKAISKGLQNRRRDEKALFEEKE